MTLPQSWYQLTKDVYTEWQIKEWLSCVKDRVTCFRVALITSSGYLGVCWASTLVSVIRGNCTGGLRSPCKRMINVSPLGFLSFRKRINFIFSHPISIPSTQNPTDARTGARWEPPDPGCCHWSGCYCLWQRHRDRDVLAAAWSIFREWDLHWSAEHSCRL